MTRWSESDDRAIRELLPRAHTMAAAAAMLTGRIGRRVTLKALEHRCAAIGIRPSSLLGKSVAAPETRKVAPISAPAPVEPDPDIPIDIDEEALGSLDGRGPARFDIEAAKAVLGRHSTIGGAARELGLTKSALSHRFRSRRIFAANFLAKVALPEGMRLRELVTRDDGSQTVYADVAPKEPAPEVLPAGHLIRGISSYVGPDGSVRAQWVKTAQDRATREASFWAACESATERYRGIAPASKAPAKSDRDLHVVIPLGDPHVGMMSWGPETGHHFDIRIAERELFAVVEDLVARAPAAETATLLNLGDYFHAQDDRQVTPGHGNKLDVDGRSAKVQEIGFALMRRLVDCALARFQRVQAIMVPGNHDPDLSRMLAIWLRAVYEREPRVTVCPNYNPFHYWTHGKNLFGTVHGNGLKLRDLPGIMAADRPELWGQTTHRFIHTGHVHHDHVTEVQGTLVYTWRTVAPNDSWSHSKGYRAGKSLCALAYTREGGEVSRVSVDLGCVQRRIAAESVDVG